MSICRLASAFVVASCLCFATSAQTGYFTFDATVSSPNPTRVDYTISVGGLRGSALDPYLRGRPFALYVYLISAQAGNDMARVTVNDLTRIPLATGAGSFAIPLRDGPTPCIFSLEALPSSWGVSGIHDGGVRVPRIGANAPTRVGVVGGAYTVAPESTQVHNLINSVIIPLPKSLGVEVMRGQKTLVLRDPVTGETRYMQVAPWTHWLETNNGERILKEVVGYFQNKKNGASGPYYENLEIHAVPSAQVTPPSFRVQPELVRASSIALHATAARGSGRYVFDCNIWSPQEILVDGPLVKVLRYRGSMRPTGAITGPVSIEHCPIVNIIVEVYSGETFVNVKVLASNSRFEGAGDFIFDEMRLVVPGAHIRTHNYRPESETFDLYRIDRSGDHSIRLVPSIGGGMHNRLRESGSFLWNTGMFAEFGTPGNRVERAADNLRVYLTQFFGDPSLGANYFDQIFVRCAGIPDLRYQGMMADWKTAWNVPSGINDNAKRAFASYVPSSRLFLSDGNSPYLFPHACFGPWAGSTSGVDEAIMPRNGAVVLAYNANSVYQVEAIETALFMGRGALTRQPIDTLFLSDGNANSLDHMRYRMWSASGPERIPEARMLGGAYFFNSGNQTRSLFHPNLDYRTSAEHAAHIAGANVPYNELLEAHDTEHNQRYVTHVMESMWKMNPDFLGKIYMDAAAEMLCSLSYYTGEPGRQYAHISYGTSLLGMVNSPQGSGAGGRSFEAFGLHAEAMFHRPRRESDSIIGRQLADIVRRVARANGYMGCLYGPDARHFSAAEEAGLRAQVSQYLTQILSRSIGPDDFDLQGVDLRWQADIWNMIVGSVAKAYLGSDLDAEARVVLTAIDREMVGCFSDRFDGAYSVVHGSRVHIGLEYVKLGQTTYAVPGSIKTGPNANMSGGPYERWVLGLYNELPLLRAHMATTGRLNPDFRGNNRNLMLPVSGVGQEGILGSGIQTMWAMQQLRQ